MTAVAKSLELDRIVQLPRRKAVDCERHPVTRRWSPEAEALIANMTAKFSRGPRLSCGCRDRVVLSGGGGRIVIFPEGKLGAPPPLPIETTMDAFLRDSVHDQDACQVVERLRSGQQVEIKGLGRRCITSFNPMQAWVLREAPHAGGILGFISIGGGKTLVGILVALAIPGVRSAVILAKPDQRLHYKQNYLQLREHFVVPSIVFDQDDLKGSYWVEGTPVVRFVPYSILQQPRSTGLLESLAPDLIVADEAHSLAAAPSSRRRGSARAVRFIRYMNAHNGTRFCAWSGSLVNKSILDMAHLATHALGMGSPYPIVKDEVEAWSAVIDPGPMSDHSSGTALALLRAFGRQGASEMTFSSGFTDGGIRDGLRERATSTLGVIATRSASVATSIAMHELEVPKIPKAVQEALAGVRNRWTRPDGEELVEVLDQAKCVREVLSGFFYRFVWPRGEPPELIERWFAARKLWNRELRQKLFLAEIRMDSDALCENAAERAWRVPRYEGDLPVWPAEMWPAWAAVKDLVKHDTRAVWIDDFFAQACADWAKTHVGIVWYDSRAFGLRVAELAGIPFHAGGKDAEAKILAEKGDRSIVASMASHSEGRDGLQLKFAKQLVAEPPSSGKAWDQLLGRLAREGQESETVDTWVALHASELRDALRKAMMYAEFDQEMSPNESFLLSADMDFEI